MKKIIILGYMGSGKSSVGKILSEKLTLNHLDLDLLIEKKEQKTIKEIFSERGEVYFRKIEHIILTELMHQNRSFVLSLGGGTPCYANNHLLLQNKDVISIYLKTSVDVLEQRLKNEKIARPLIANLDDDELNEYIRKHLFDRNYYYHQAKHVVSTNHKSVTEVASEIEQIVSLIA